MCVCVCTCVSMYVHVCVCVCVCVCVAHFDLMRMYYVSICKSASNRFMIFCTFIYPFAKLALDRFMISRTFIIWIIHLPACPKHVHYQFYILYLSIHQAIIKHVHDDSLPFLQGLVEELRRLFDKFLLKMLDFIRINCKQLIPIAELNGVASLCRLFDCLGTAENGVSC